MQAPAALRSMTSGCRLAIRVIPRARRTQVEGLRGGALLIRLAAPAVEGAANTALIELLADVLGVPRGAISIAAGSHHRNKTIDVIGRTASEAAQRLGLDAVPAGGSEDSSRSS